MYFKMNWLAKFLPLKLKTWKNLNLFLFTKSMNKLLRFAYILLLDSILFASAQAQIIRPNAVDSIIARENLINTVQSFYLRPLFEIQQGTTNVQGDKRFNEPNPNSMRQIGFGIRIGYRSGPLEVETGLSSVWAGAGYRFWPEYDPGWNTHIRSTSYVQILLTVRYRFWQPTPKLSLRAGIGIAFNFDTNKFSLGSSSTLKEYVYSADGNPTLAATVFSKYHKELKFWSGEVNLSAYYQLSKRFGILVEGKRLISSNSIVTLNNTREVYNPSDTQKFNANGGINGYSFNAGISYQFGFRNRYRLSEGRFTH